MNNVRTAQAEALATFILDAFRSGAIEEYTRPFQNRFATLGGQYNPVRGARYQGSNQMFLSAVALQRGVADNRWMTFKQARDLGCHVRRGAKSVPVAFFTALPIDEKDEDGEEVTRKVWRHYNVFNGSDIEGLPPEQEPIPMDPKERHALCEQLMADSPAPIRHVPGSYAYYDAGVDEIVLPMRDQFRSAEAFYAVALHEMGHSTGHASRLNRDMRGVFGSEQYAKEELRAEIASMLACQRLGLQHEVGHHIAYLDSWSKILADKPTEILSACADAEKICDYLGILAPTLEPMVPLTPDAEATARVADQARVITRVLEQTYLANERRGPELAM